MPAIPSPSFADLSAAGLGARTGWKRTKDIVWRHVILGCAGCGHPREKVHTLMRRHPFYDLEEPDQGYRGKLGGFIGVAGLLWRRRPEVRTPEPGFELTGLEVRDDADALRSLVVQNSKFSERLNDAIARYHNRSVDALQVIQELITLAKDLKAEPDDDLSEAERSFYDALAQNENAVEVMGNQELRIIATELVKSVRESSGVDWWQREDVRAKMRVAVKRILRRHGYPPDLQSDAVRLIIRQAEAKAKSVS